MNTEILVIEDDDLVRQGIVDILELKGWNAVAAKSCSEALVRIRGEEYMLYVLDMKLPDGNGIMLCREIRRYTAKTRLQSSGSFGAFPFYLHSTVSATSNRLLMNYATSIPCISFILPPPA